MQAISTKLGTRLRYAGFRSCVAGGSLRLRSSAAAQALERLGAGVIVSQSDRRVVEMNRAGESIVRLEDGLLIRNGLLCAGRLFETTKLETLIIAAVPDGKSGAQEGRMLIRRSEHRPAYVLTIAPLRVEGVVDDRRLAMIVVVDPTRRSPSGNDLMEFFALSPAEARLAAAFLTGKKLSEIAADTGVRVTTLRTQLRSILKKVGAERQSDLMRILSNAGICSVSMVVGWLNVTLEALELAPALGVV
jgi:DNA-binding CsgD family transcriptional regulator